MGCRGEIPARGMGTKSPYVTHKKEKARIGEEPKATITILKQLDRIPR